MSLSRHLTSPSAEHGRLAFHPDCPRCQSERLAGDLAGDELISRRTQAALAAGLLAFSAAAPPTAAVAQEAAATAGGHHRPGRRAARAGARLRPRRRRRRRRRDRPAARRRPKRGRGRRRRGPASRRRRTHPATACRNSSPRPNRPPRHPRRRRQPNLSRRPLPRRRRPRLQPRHPGGAAGGYPRPSRRLARRASPSRSKPAPPAARTAANVRPGGTRASRRTGADQPSTGDDDASGTASADGDRRGIPVGRPGRRLRSGAPATRCSRATACGRSPGGCWARRPRTGSWRARSAGCGSSTRSGSAPATRTCCTSAPC